MKVAKIIQWLPLDPDVVTVTFTKSEVEKLREIEQSIGGPDDGSLYITGKIPDRLESIRDFLRLLGERVASA